MFAPDSVYVEAGNMHSRAWIAYLCGCSCVLRLPNGQPHIESVPFDECKALLSAGEPPIGPGDWVQIEGNGLYAGDAGCVLRTGERYTVLVVPRIADDVTVERASYAKRKRHPPRSEPALFEREKHTLLGEIKERGPNVLLCDRQTFQYGLLLIHITPTHLSRAKAMPNSLLAYFDVSDHPFLSENVRSGLPPPSEWILELDDRVLVNGSTSSGVICRIDNLVEVKMDDGSGIQAVPYRDVAKFITTGDFIEVLSGPACSTRGYVDAVEDNHILQVVRRQHDIDQFSYAEVRSKSHHFISLIK